VIEAMGEAVPVDGRGRLLDLNAARNASRPQPPRRSAIPAARAREPAGAAAPAAVGDHRDGGRSYEVSASPLRGGDGRPGGAAARDDDARRQAEDALRRAKEELQQANEQLAWLATDARTGSAAGAVPAAAGRGAGRARRHLRR
jgi:hypothetical protein